MQLIFMLGPHTGPLPHLRNVTVKRISKNTLMKQNKGLNGDLAITQEKDKQDRDEPNHRHRHLLLFFEFDCRFYYQIVSYTFLIWVPRLCIMIVTVSETLNSNF